MTPQQHRALLFIRKFCADRGYPPSLSEIGAELGLKARSSAKRVVDALVAAGAVNAERGRSRSLWPADPAIKVPLRAEVRVALEAFAKAQSISPEVAAAEAISAYLGASS
ncbi:LexA family protein [Azorhizobium doebereinerae]|uniref:LexA family protein n=1 Tax=Azorhizobium doebereinerae TaxID=281091 RepID=UPI00041371E1|nr:hypothetical protein [Azorhizobium doebereinerae]